MEYGEIANDSDCTLFDPQMTEPVNVSKLDQAMLLELLTACSKGDKIEFCVKKEKNQNLRDVIIIDCDANGCTFVIIR